MKSKSLKFFLVLTVFWVSCQSCFQFRKSDKKQLELLSSLPSNYNVELGHKTGLDRQIHYTYVGSTSDKPLAVFVHGSPGSSSNFLDYTSDTALLRYYNVLLFDRPGYGYSDFGNAEPSILKQADMLNDALSDFSESEKVLVGHSLGGPIIANMAMKKPNAYRGLLIVAGSVSPELEPEEKWRKPLDSPLLRWMLPKSFRVSNQELLPVESELKQMENQWDQIKLDVQVIQGGKDNLVPPGNADYAEQQLINANDVKVYLLPEENHFIPFTKPELIREALIRF